MEHIMKIAEIRSAIDSLNWSRNDLSGATRDEFKRMDVKSRLQKHIEICKALDIKPRFARDAESRDSAIEYAEKTIARWEDMQEPKVEEVKPRTEFKPVSVEMIKETTYVIGRSRQDHDKFMEYVRKNHAHYQKHVVTGSNSVELTIVVIERFDAPKKATITRIH
jgi:hypothetical protein